MRNLAAPRAGRPRLLAQLGVLAAAVGSLACATEKIVSRQGRDLVPKQAAPGRPEVELQADAPAAQLALALGNALAEAGVLVHLAGNAALPPEARGHVYLVALGAPAATEDCSFAGRVAIAPPEPLVLDPACASQPLLVLRRSDPKALEPSARPLWELRFEGLATYRLTPDEQHTLLEAVALWVRNRAADG